MAKAAAHSCQQVTCRQNSGAGQKAGEDKLDVLCLVKDESEDVAISASQRQFLKPPQSSSTLCMQPLEGI
jgi:hypothetical protein